MKHAKKIYIPAQEGELKTISVDDIEGGAEPSAADETALKKRAAYLLINGVPPFWPPAGRLRPPAIGSVHPRPH